MPEYEPKTAGEWLAILLSNFQSKAGFTPDDGTVLHALLYALSVGLAQGDVQRTLIYWQVHPELATRLGLELLADDLGISYSQATPTSTLRGAVRLARLSAIGSKAWYEALPPILYPTKVTSARATKDLRGVGSVVVQVFFNGQPVDKATVAALQQDFDGDDFRPMTDRVRVITGEKWVGRPI